MDIIPKTPQKALTPHLQHTKQPGGFEKEDKASDDCSSCENTHFSPHCRKLEISSLNSFLGTYSLKIPVWERDFFFFFKAGYGQFYGEGNGNPLQYACLENPMDRGAWWTTVHEVAKSQARLSD